MRYLLFTIILIFTGCHKPIDNANFNYKQNLNELINAYIFLSENHDLLHIMMGEYEGSPIESYQIYQNKISPLIKNKYIKPILFGLNNITIENNLLKNADRFDALVDYYQMGLQIMINGVLKGSAYNDKLPESSDDYKKILTMDLLNE